MSKVRIELNRAGITQILKSPSMRSAVERRARQIAAASGPGYEADSMIGRNRARASVYAKSFRARRDNARNNTILRNIGAARRG